MSVSDATLGEDEEVERGVEEEEHGEKEAGEDRLQWSVTPTVNLAARIFPSEMTVVDYVWPTLKYFC